MPNVISTERRFIMIRQPLRVALCGLALVLFMVLFASAARAQGLASTSGFGESVLLDLMPLGGGAPIDISSGPLPMVAGIAPPTADLAASLGSVKVPVSTYGNVIETGLLHVDGLSQMPFAFTSVSDALASQVIIKLIGPTSFLVVKADVASSQSLVACGSGANPTATGTVGLTNGKINGVAFDPNPAPNTVLINQPGLRVVANEQILTVNHFSTDLVVNAIHVYVSNLPVDNVGTLTADLVVAQSHARMLLCLIPE